ncbi:unnamed protein product [Protopolystoma xenopodis]|uniref:Secreted protein n=1 Tax=Protopolystoma xenopodis TaxID=117903 RepID=A0A448XRH8_9PLAT|nr:unnamed protein product [Protopolystoma xenopodis]
MSCLVGLFRWLLYCYIYPQPYHNQQNDKFETIQSRAPFLACARPAPIFVPNSLYTRFCAHPPFAELDDKSLQHKSAHMNTLFCSNPI